MNQNYARTAINPVEIESVGNFSRAASHCFQASMLLKEGCPDISDVLLRTSQALLSMIPEDDMNAMKEAQMAINVQVLNTVGKDTSCL